MIIQNFFYINNNIQNKNLKRNNTFTDKRISFAGKQDILTKTIQADAQELSKISFIAEAYEKILKLIAPLNGTYQTKFKSMYPNLVSGEKIKGFVFNSIDGLKNKRLQLVRFNTKDSSDELITFGVLNAENKNLLRFRVNKQGLIELSSDKENISALRLNPFDNKDGLDLKKYLQSIVNEIVNFKNYSENFKTISKNFAGEKSNKNILEVLTKINSLKSSEGIKSEIDLISKNYSDLIMELNSKNQKHAILLKQDYWGKDYPFAGKGLYFQNLENSGKNVTFCPLQSKEDNRIFKVVIQNDKGILENSFVFFEDGKVATQKVKGLETNYFRPNNLVNISDSEIDKYGLKNVFQALNNEFGKFKSFILEKRNEKIEKNIEIQEKIKKVQDKKSEIQKLKADKLKEKELKLREKELLKQKNELIKQEKQKQKELKAKLKAEKEKLKEQKQLNLQKTKQITKQKSISKTDANSTVEMVKEIDKKYLLNVPMNYSAITLNKISEGLNNLFNLSVEERSSHLIHELLPNGNVFSGRFSFEASDGAKITVSRIKSPKYVDFTYYSIRANKNGAEFILNLDSEAGRIINSENGKPVINKKCVVTYMSKEEFLNRNPLANNLPKYLNEIFEIREGKTHQIINTNLKIKKKEVLLKQKEQEVLDALKINNEEDFLD